MDSIYEKADHVDIAKGAKGMSDAEIELLQSPGGLKKHIDALEKKMHEAASNLEFEEAARLRDEIKRLEDKDLGL
jgi:excinuclease ABC subunit B